MCCLNNVCVVTAGTSCDDRLLYLEAFICDLVNKVELCFALGNFCSLFFYTVKDVAEVCIEFVDLVSVAWVERKGDHWFYGT